MRKSRSVFFRVYAILLASCLTVAAFAAGLFAVQMRQRRTAGLSGDVYLRTPDDVVWTTRTDEAFRETARRLEGSGAPGVGRDGTSPYAMVRRDGGFVLVYGAPLASGGRLYLGAAAAFFLLAGIGLASYLAMRTVLAPLKNLGEGVVVLRSGDFSYRMDDSGSDEFADLAASFNDLAERIRHQLEMKEQLLLDVSHELRSPLTRMAVAAEFIPDEQLRGTLREDVLELERKIGQILLSSRLGSPYGVPRVREIDAEGFLREAAARFAGTPPGVVLVSAEDRGSFRADPELAATAIRNILENACRYSDPGAGPVELSSRRKEGWFEIEVRDRGPGVPADAGNRLFEPFYRADPSRDRGSGGFGIGLYLCARILKAHGGSAALENAPGGGALAVLRFPG